MTAVVVVGTQWGDEGKGKMIDYLASEAQMVIRCQGGSNAGHTVVSGDDVYKLHLVPSGILYPGVSCIIGNGVVIDVATILDELDGLKERGIDGKNLSISDRAQMIMPYHIRLDAMQEDMKGENKIGTTKKGIGPAYVDKYARTGLRIGDLLDWPAFLAKLHQNVVEKNHLLTSYGLPPVDEKEIADLYVGYRERILPYIADTAPVINASIDKGDKVLFEGAQGTLLDIDHGTYPFVTSSYPTAGGVCIGAGVGPTKIDKVLGITKAYTTRVGDGPFPCELHDKMGDVLR
ncbi:MAG: adenylosuccinate synthase, partial [Clostridiales bacterium]